MQYRREIDGPRALALVPVIVVHAGFAAFKRGFISKIIRQLGQESS
jgi:peptidoglycan/LPS O-acetylase OafA/YrhL